MYSNLARLPQVVRLQSQHSNHQHAAAAIISGKHRDMGRQAWATSCGTGLLEAAKQRESGAGQKDPHGWDHLGSEFDMVKKKHRVEMERSSAGLGRASQGVFLECSKHKPASVHTHMLFPGLSSCLVCSLSRWLPRG